MVYYAYVNSDMCRDVTKGTLRKENQIEFCITCS